jgi:hypothetical protein
LQAATGLYGTAASAPAENRPTIIAVIMPFVIFIFPPLKEKVRNIR